MIVEHSLLTDYFRKLFFSKKVCLMEALLRIPRQCGTESAWQAQWGTVGVTSDLEVLRAHLERLLITRSKWDQHI